MKKISFLVTAWKEEKTIGKCIECLVKEDFSGLKKILNELQFDDYELLLAAPDLETREAAKKKAIELGIEEKLILADDKGGGKPKGLNLLLELAKGDVFIFTDGDVHFGENATFELLKPLIGKDLSKKFLVTGRPISEDPKNNMMGYFGHLLADAAHHKRNVELLDEEAGHGTKFVKRLGFFPVSGYIYAGTKSCFNAKENFPPDCLVDDAYISYIVFNDGGKIQYAPKAEALIKYPTNLSDYFKQKKRSTGGYVQLWEYGVVKTETKTRSFRKELEYFWYPLKYAKNLKEVFWSLVLYPVRFWLWVMIFWERRVTKKDFVRTWVRIESTK